MNGGATLLDQLEPLLRGRYVATAESVTAGRVAAALAMITDATQFLRGGLVAYQETVKRSVLDVTAESIFSAEAARQMALGAIRRFDADIAVSTTGLAGHEPRDGVPGGTVFIGLSTRGLTTAHEHHFEGEPWEVVLRASDQALVDLLELLQSCPPRGDL